MGLDEACLRVDDSVLLERWGQGDRGAAADLLAKYAAELLRFFRSQQPKDADDLLQETLLAVIEARARFRGDSSFRTYLLRVARYKLWSLRRRRRTPHVLLEDAEEDPALQAATTSELARSSERSLRDEDLEAALERLEPKLSRVILLNFENLGREAIARELGIPAGTVASRIRLAKTQLKAWLEAEVSARA
jgi:RNA polymerase sigma factor (sigma-70 family)